MKYQDLLLLTENLSPIRKELYHSQGPGYYVFRGFLEDLFTDHILNFWNTEVPNARVPVKTLNSINKGKDFFNGCPNFALSNRFGITYYNFFWNHPPDEVTYAIAWKIVELRNMVMGKNFFFRIFPDSERDNRSVSFRVVFTKNGDQIVPNHQDWIGEKTFDPAALQATLVLSDHGKDYEGEGMIFKTNDGSEICLNRDLNLRKGDLVLWKYNNEHSVRNVNSSEKQVGFARIIFPPELFSQESERQLLERVSLKQMGMAIPRRVKSKLFQRGK